MGPDRNTHLRNIAIVLVLALGVWLLPGGDTGSQTILNVLAVIFWGGLAFFAYRLYMEHRSTIFGLGDQVRALLYGSIGVAALALLATSRLWDAGGLGALAWLLLLGAAIYGLVRVYRLSREY